MDVFQEDPVQKMNHSLYLKHPVVSQSQGDLVAGQPSPCKLRASAHRSAGPTQQ